MKVVRHISIVLNLVRACEAAIGLAMHSAAKNRPGIPQSSREAFDLPLQAERAAAGTVSAIKNMVGFLNIALHSHQQLQRPILAAIFQRHLADFETDPDEILHA